MITDRSLFLCFGNAILEQTAPGSEMLDQELPYERAVIGDLGAEIAEQAATDIIGIALGGRARFGIGCRHAVLHSRVGTE